MSLHPLRAYRKEKEITQAELGKVLGVSDATITHIETGRRTITPKNAIEWEAKIGVSRAVLCPEIFGDGKATPATTAAEKEAA